MVSVIVPIYNAERCLHHCVNSILSQTYTDFELLLINDGSMDKSGAICDEYAARDNRVRVYHKENGGASSARNLGLDKAKGEWIAFVDSDDTIEQNALELLLCSFNESIDVVIANTEQDITITNNEWIKLLLCCKIRCELWGGLYKRSFLCDKKNEIPSSIVIGEDFLTNLQYAINCKKIRLISDNIYNYTQGKSTSLVNSYKLSLEHEKELLKCMDSILMGKENIFRHEIFRKKYLTLERLVFIGQKPYHEEWVRGLMNEKSYYIKKMGIKEIILLSVPFALFCQLVLKIGLYIKTYYRS